MRKRHKSPNFWPLLATATVLIIATFMLRNQGRFWICSCNEVWLWSGDIWSAHNSQHILDPYSFTHVLHGLAFWAILHWLAPQWPLMWRFWVAIAVESLWEVVENAAFIIDRYREATIALGYEGDSIVNSLADIALCGLGFYIAQRIGWRWALLLFITTEIALTLWIRDSLLLNVLMLLAPVDSIRDWQAGLQG
ncbi:MAG: DUF2585 family protein [Chloroflexota bacterium]